MSEQVSQDSEPNIIPMGVVIIVIGIIILVTVLAVWIVAPTYMPQPLYDFIDGYLPETRSVIVVPTPAAEAAVPEPVTLLPETPAETEAEAYPSYFISADEAVKREVGAGDPIRIVIPDIGLDAPVSGISLEKFVDGEQTYYQWPVPNEFLVGWHDNSARLGVAGNTVLNGHHNVHGEVFRGLIDLEEGAEIILYDQAQSFVYRVTMMQVLAERDQPLAVRMENAQWIAPTEDERVTLITCWPYTDNSHRLVVVAEPVAAGVETAVTH